jgi:hypothetical protein
MKFIFALIFCVLTVSARLVRRVTQAGLTEAINGYVTKYGDTASYWNILYLGNTAMMDAYDPDGQPILYPDGSPVQFDAGHHWVVAAPLGPNGEYNGKPYVKVHLSYSASAPNKPSGYISTSIGYSPNANKEMAATTFKSGVTVNTFKPSDLMTGMASSIDATYADGAPYYMFNSDTNCQGCSRSLFDNVYNAIIRPTEPMDCS